MKKLHNIYNKIKLREVLFMIDLRSDTLTLPTKEMLETILSAPLGDDGRLNANGRG